MWLTIIMILLTVAMVVGPIMLIQPSGGVQKIAKIRLLANQNGLIIRMPAAQGHTGAEYYLPLGPTLRQLASQNSWTLEQKTISHEIHFHETWDWRGRAQALTTLWPSLHEFIVHLPKGIAAVGLTTGGVFCEWDERCRGASELDAVLSIKKLLEGLAGQIEERCAAALEPEEDSSPFA